jgi:hypothetical protein
VPSSRLAIFAPMIRGSGFESHLSQSASEPQSRKVTTKAAGTKAGCRNGYIIPYCIATCRDAMTISLDLDPAFADFNFSEGWDPTLRQGPASSTLYKLVCDARRGNRLAASDFADTIYWTLRPETWDCFQRVHGARPITHREWFFAKVAQFLDILVYDQLTIVGSDGQPRKLQPNEVLTDETTIWRGSGPLIQSDEIERALVAEEWATYQWLDLVQNVSDKREDRAGAVQTWLREQRLAHQGDPTSRPRIGWTKNEKRDQIILHSLGRGSALSQYARSWIGEASRRYQPSRRRTFPGGKTAGLNRDRGTRFNSCFPRFKNVNHLSSLVLFPNSFQITQ